MINRVLILIVLVGSFLTQIKLSASTLSDYTFLAQGCCDSVIDELVRLCSNDSLVEGKHIGEPSKESLRFKAFIAMVKCKSEGELLELLKTSQNNSVIAYAYMGLKIKNSSEADKLLPKYFKKIKYVDGDLVNVYSDSKRFIEYINKNQKRLQYIYLKA